MGGKLGGRRRGRNGRVSIDGRETGGKEEREERMSKHGWEGGKEMLR